MKTEHLHSFLPLEKGLSGSGQKTSYIFGIPFILSLCLLSIAFSVSAQTTRYVKPVATGLGNGSSWANASADVQAMINASAANDKLWIAAGTYKPSRDGAGNTNPVDPRSKVFTLKSGVGVYGGFAGTETLLSQRNFTVNVTVLSGDLNGDDVGFTNNSENSYTVVSSFNNTNTTILDGVTISGGNASGGSGGGLNMYNSASQFSNCIFTGNLATYNGSMLVNGGTGNFSKCTFVGNTAQSGGAVYINYASPTFSACIFKQNSAYYGGVIYNANGNPAFTNCSFLSNTATVGGLINSGNGEADARATLTNCTIKSNTSTASGIIYLYNCAITIRNCIIWGNSSVFTSFGGGPSVVEYSIIQGGYAGTGNLSADPLFVSSTDLHLQECSPAVDAGTSVGAPATDIEGNSRPVNVGYDMGAYEYQTIFSRPEINLQGNGTSIFSTDVSPSSADNTDYGNVDLNTPLSRSFTIQNLGTASLTISSITSSNAAFVVSGAPSTIAPGSSAAFMLTFTATFPLNVYNATITINNNDCNESTYTFEVKGRANCPTAFPATTTNNGLSFDGLNDYVDISQCSAGTPLMNGGDALTIEYWFKGTHLQSAVRFQAGLNYVIAGFTGNNVNNIPKHIIYTDGGTDGLNVAPSTAALYDNKWHHISMTWQRNTTNGFKSYFDGQLIAERNSGTNALPVIGNAILGSYLGLGEFLNGALDEVRIWNVVRTQTEIAASMNCGVGVPQNGLVAYYKFDNGNAGGTNTNLNFFENVANPGTHSLILRNFALTGNNSNVVASTAGIRTFYIDADGDGHGTNNQTTQACSAPAGYSIDNTDCDDNDNTKWQSSSLFVDADGDGYNAGQVTVCYGANIPVGYSQTTNGSDCNDNNSAINPGATEVCNSIDDDCDGQIDEGVIPTWYRDFDNDGYSDGATLTQCSKPTFYKLAVDLISTSGDCIDGIPAVNPGATEVCNGRDDNCDGQIDEGVIPTWYRDVDNDGYSDGATLTQCSKPTFYKLAADLISTSGDCNEGNPAANPGATEVCNSIDDNCDGQIDEGVIPTWYKDVDNDGYSDGTSLTQCSKPTVFKLAADLISISGDCIDGNPAVNPGATEVCNSIDDDCDGQIDEGVLPTWYLDVDNDGYSDGATVTQCPKPTYYKLAADLIATSGDCNDFIATVYPGATELCNGRDDDCDGLIDENLISTWYQDFDNDGYSNGLSIVQCTRPGGFKLATELFATNGDCNNYNAAINPGATEVCNNIDDDCDGQIDEGVIPTWYKDADNDGYSDGISVTQCARPSTAYKLPADLTAISGDCDDTKGAINPGATEVCGNNIDDNCNGSIDENCARTWYFDYDGDGYGNKNKPLVSLTKPSRYVDNGDDCRDWMADVYPGAPELPDNIDNDCDGETDEGLVCRRKWYFDRDGDRYGNPNAPFRWSCIAIDGYIDNNLDCRDWDATVNPAAAEICDGKDNDCDGLTDESCIIVGVEKGKPNDAAKPLAMAPVDDKALVVNLWPNPARDVLMVTLDEFVPNQKLDITLMQADGKVQQAQSLVPTIKGQQVRMDVSRAAGGYYILAVKQSGKVINRQVVILR